MDKWAIIGLTALIGAVGTVAVALLLRRRVPPEELERRRRLAINAAGRMVDATVVDVQDGVVQYSYEVRGVTYTAAQDLRQFAGAPEDPALLLGIATVKYLPKAPTSSIIFCENWSGMRRWVPVAPEVHSIQKES
jgi:hypothetical protein